MNLGELREELQGRGFDYLPATRQTAFINRAYQEMCAEEDWPFLEATTSGNAPLTISDLRTIEAVVDSTNTRRLQPLDRRNILDSDWTLATTGNPVNYYLTTGTTVNVYPANTSNTIAVRYWSVPAALDDDGDEPVIPSPWHQMIVDGAVAYAYFDSDNFEAAREMLNLWGESKIRMREALLVGQRDGPDDFISVVAGSEDGGYY